jgi:hypothetical protein
VTGARLSRSCAAEDFRAKKRGPLQAVPVIARAIADRRAQPQDRNGAGQRQSGPAPHRHGRIFRLCLGGGHHSGDRLASAFGAASWPGVVRQKLALTLHSEKLDGERVYRVRRADMLQRSPPQPLTADLLRRMIANRVQEEAFGTLDRATLKRLDGVARRSGRGGNRLVRPNTTRQHRRRVSPERDRTRSISVAMAAGSAKRGRATRPAQQCKHRRLGQRPIQPGREDHSPRTTGRSASMLINPNTVESSKR